MHDQTYNRPEPPSYVPPTPPATLPSQPDAIPAVDVPRVAPPSSDPHEGRNETEQR
jgi:hypothetical protein